MRNSLEEAARCSAVVQMRKGGMEGDIISVNRMSDPVISITLGLEETMVNSICVYAHQTRKPPPASSI